MKALLLIAMLAGGMSALAQTYNMPATGNVSTCSGTFYDSGGAAAAYGTSETRVYTICPSTAGAKVRVNFTSFDVENNFDFLTVYDGNSTGAPTLGTYTGTAGPGMAQATASNTSGCLTFRFTSDGSVNNAGWVATISCTVPCQTINAVFGSANEAPAPDGIIRICQGQSVNFQGSGTFSTSGAGATYQWRMGNGATVNGTNINYTYTTPGSYSVNMIITDPNGCQNNNFFNQIVEVSTTPTIPTTASPTSVCVNNPVTLTANPTMTPYSTNCTPPVSGTTFLPDGSGVSYTTTITTNCYPTGSTITAASDFNNICLSLEHTYLGDLNIRFICPNGQSMVLKAYSQGGGGTYLGNPIDNDPSTNPGTGRLYCFTPTASTFLVNGTTSTAGTPAGPSINAGDYMPFQPFSQLVGCPLNGNWTIEVTDNLAADNGYIFSWDFNLVTSLASVPSFTPTIASQGWVAASGLTTTSPTQATVVPTTAGNPCFTYSLTDNFGCTYTANQCFTVTAGTNPTFTPIAAICQGSTPPALPGTSNNGFSGTWNPSTISTATTGSTTYTFTPNVGQCANTATLTVTVNPATVPTFNPLAAVCQNAAAPTLPPTSTNGISGTWSPGTATTTSPGTFTFTFTPSGSGCNTTATLTLTVNPLVTPTFPSVGPLCQGSTAPALPVPSNEGINGSWSAATINTASAGSSVHTFTPSGATCTTTASLTVVINPRVTPTFPIPAAVCQGDPAPALPNPSNEGFNGTWNPTTFSTASPGTSTSTFTPAVGVCATTATLSLTINAPVTPTFPAPVAVCQGDAAPVLPNPSNEGFAGIWNPTSFSTASAGTSVCTFTPTGGACATTASLSLTINPPVTPTFPTPAAVCEGAPAPALPSTSNEGFSGTWDPTTFSTATAGTSVCTFTPASGVCATTATLSLTVNPLVTPTFPIPAAVCQGAAAPALPNPSNEGFNGTWNPTAFSTAASGTSTCTFTPSGAVCATTATLSLTVNAPTTPTFNPIPPMCVGDPAPSLQLPSNEGDPGSWMPATISTGTAGTQTYTFTPSAGTCVTTATISVTVGPPAVPTFTPVGPFCQGDAIDPLPTVSNEAIPGSWSPVAMNNMSTTTYIFSPTPGVCATTASMTVVINPPVTPTFAAVGPYCVGETIPPLPTSSNEGITGQWDPAIDNTATTVYTFTPDAGQCATTATITIVINPSIMPTFTTPPPFCEGGIAPVLPTTSNNSITGTWDPTPVDNMASGTYTFTPDAGQCASSMTMSITVNPNPVITVPPVTTCENTDVIMNASGGTTYSWAPAAGLSSTTGSSVTVNVPAPGPYTYTITGTDGSGCSGTATTTVTIAAGLTISVNPPSANLCVGESVVLTASGGVNYTWSPPGGLSATTGATVTADPISTTTYTVIGESAGCTGQTTVVITVGSPTTPTFNPITALCSGSSAPILQNPSNENINGTWIPAIVSNSASGTYTFTPAAGVCATTASIDIAVNPNPTIASVVETCDGTNTSYVVTVTISGGTAPFTLTENAPGGIGGSFAGSTWTSNAIPSGTAYDFDFFDATGCGPAKAAGSKNCNCATDVGTMSVTPISLCGTASASPAYNSAGEFQDADDVQSYILHTSAGGTPGTVIQSNTSGTFSFAAPMVYGTTYYISAVVGNDGGSGLVDLNDPCLAMATGTPVVWYQAPTATPTNNGPLCEGAAVCVFGPAGAGYTYQWTGPNAFTSTMQNPTIPTGTVANGGVYTLIITANGCASAPANTTVVINAPVLPTFNPINAVCQGAAAPTLPSPSTNGVTGTWAPSFVNTSSAGTQTFTFNPTLGQCATSTTISATIHALPTPSATSASTCPNTPVGVCASGGVTYQWSPNNGLSSTTIDCPTVTLSGNQTYNILVTDANGCSATTTSTVTILPNLVISVNPPSATICAGDVATLTASGAASYSWSPGAGLNVTNQPTVNASPVGTQIYTVTGNTNGCTGTVNVTVNVNPVPVMTPISNVAQCEGTTVASVPFNATPAGSDFLWSGSNAGIGLSGSPTSSSTPAFTGMTGMSTVVVTPTLNGCEGSPTSFTFTIHPNPVVNATSNSPVCEGGVLDLDAQPSGLSYNWSGPAGFGNTNQSPSISPVSVNQAGSYTIVVFDANGCSGSDIENVIVNPLPTPSINPMGPYCIDDNTAYPITVVPATLIPSFSGSGAAGSNFTPSAVGTSGPVTINCSATDAKGCVGSTTAVITINPLPAVTISADPLSGCAPLIVTFTTDGGMSSSTWDFGDGASGVDLGTGSIMHTYTATGTYDVIVTNMQNGCTNTATALDFITVEPDPLADFSVRDIELTITDPTVHITNQSIGAATYSWTFGDGSGSSTAVDPTYTYAEEPATYTIDLVATSAAGCVDEATMTIIVKDQLIFWVPNTFTPDGDAYNNTFQPVFQSGYDPYHFSLFIFNRWGEIVFESHDVTVGWDGTYRGEIVQQGSYTWTIETKDPQTDEVSRFEGHVNIMR